MFNSVIVCFLYIIVNISYLKFVQNLLWCTSPQILQFEGFYRFYSAAQNFIHVAQEFTLQYLLLLNWYAYMGFNMCIETWYPQVLKRHTYELIDSLGFICIYVCIYICIYIWANRIRWIHSQVQNSWGVGKDTGRNFF